MSGDGDVAVGGWIGSDGGVAGRGKGVAVVGEGRHGAGGGWRRWKLLGLGFWDCGGGSFLGLGPVRNVGLKNCSNGRIVGIGKEVRFIPEE